MVYWIIFNFQIDVDIGSSSVARSVIGLVLGYVTSIVVDLAILIEVCVFLIVTYFGLPTIYGLLVVNLSR